MDEELSLERMNNINYCMTSQEVGEVEREFRRICVGSEDMIILNIHLAVCFQGKYYDTAMKEIVSIIGRFDAPEHKAYLILRQGQISEFQGNFDAGLKFYYSTLAIGKWPVYVRYYLWNRIAFCWLLKQRFKSAEWCCRKAIKLNPKRWYAWKNLGGSLQRQGKFIEAWQSYSRAVFLFRIN